MLNWGIHSNKEMSSIYWSKWEILYIEVILIEFFNDFMQHYSYSFKISNREYYPFSFFQIIKTSQNSVQIISYFLLWCETLEICSRKTIYKTFLLLEKNFFHPLFYIRSGWMHRSDSHFHVFWLQLLILAPFSA